MKLKTYRTLWGTPSPRDAAVAAFQEAGYDGIETMLFTKADQAEIASIVRRRRISFKGGIWTRLGLKSVDEHVRLFKVQLAELLRAGAESANVIGGYDCWSDDDAARYFDAVLKEGDASGIPISHEIHRDSALFHPVAARRILGKFPELKLTLDFSHWVVACERLIDDQLDLIRLCGSRALHIHSRVGTEEAPQVGDIRSPEALPYLLAHERWWDIVWEEQAARGIAVTTMCPEFGPPPYLPALPYTGVPVANQAEVIDWQRDRQVARFKAWSASRKGSSRMRR
jgi:hypothetical protein